VFSPWFLAAMGANQQQPWQLGWAGKWWSPSPSSSEPQQLLVACQVILATWRRRARVRSTLVCSILPHARGRLARAAAFSGRVTRSRPGLKAVTRAGQLTRLVQMSALIFGSAPSGGELVQPWK